MKLVFYGAGNMAHAIFTGIVSSKVIDSKNIYLTNRSNEVALKEYANELGVNYSYDAAAVLEDADYVFVGAQRYHFDELADRIKAYIADKNKFISNRAGLQISYIREKFASNNPTARIMPN